MYNSKLPKLNPEEIELLRSKDISIPLKVLIDREVAVLEAIVEYLKDTLNYTYHQIGILINRDERNIWTVYQRAKKKRQK